MQVTTAQRKTIQPGQRKGTVQRKNSARGDKTKCKKGQAGMERARQDRAAYGEVAHGEAMQDKFKQQDNSTGTARGTVQHKNSARGDNAKCKKG